jgi:hypothetical protein
MNARLATSPTYRLFYGEGVYIRSSNTNVYLTLISDDREVVSERAVVSEDGARIAFTGQLEERGPLRVREATFGMPLQVALAMAAAVVQHLNINHHDLLTGSGVSLEIAEQEAKQ